MTFGGHFQVGSAPVSRPRHRALSVGPAAADAATCIVGALGMVTKNYTEIWRRLKKRHLPGAAQQNPMKKPILYNKNNGLNFIRRCENWQANCSYMG
jgi:hypothetical protein